MAKHADDQPTLLMERRVLQALCQGDSNVLQSAKSLLSRYLWHEPIHQIIFGCLASSSACGPVALRERLAECATRKGFPDVDWGDFFPPHPISTREAEKLILQLWDL